MNLRFPPALVYIFISVPLWSLSSSISHSGESHFPLSSVELVFGRFTDDGSGHSRAIERCRQEEKKINERLESLATLHRLKKKPAFIYFVSNTERNDQGRWEIARDVNHYLWAAPFRVENFVHRAGKTSTVEKAYSVCRLQIASMNEPTFVVTEDPVFEISNDIKVCEKRLADDLARDSSLVFGEIVKWKTWSGRGPEVCGAHLVRVTHVVAKPKASGTKEDEPKECTPPREDSPKGGESSEDKGTLG